MGGIVDAVGGAIGDVVGGVGHHFGIGGGPNQFKLPGQDYTAGIGTAQAGALDQTGQQSLIQQLQQRMLGQGPSVAENLLRHQTDVNNAGAASAISSVRGMNPALQARMILDQKNQNMQAAAGQGATLRAGEMTSAAGMLGSALGQNRGQNIGALATLGGMQGGVNEINAGVAGQNAGMVDKNIGGLLGAAGSAMGMGGTGAAGGAGAIPQNQWNAITMSPGGDVPGQARAPGDSGANDTVPALLSPHEIVLPRSVTLAENAPELAADFVRAIRGRLGKPAREQTIEAAHGTEIPDPTVEPSTGAQTTPESADPLGPFRGLIGEDLPAPAADTGPAATQGPGMLARPADADMVAARPQAAAPATGPGMGTPGGTVEMQRGERQQIAGIQGEARAAEGFAHDQTGVMDSWNAARQQLTSRFQQEMQAHATKSEQLFNSLLDPKNDVNPNRFWEQKSTGGKIMASIGMILGGMPAVDNINKAIDRDVEAQKLNVGKRQNALSQYMQMGRDMQSAHLLASADMKDAAAAQLARAAAAYAGTKAGADAQVQIGALRQSAFQARQQATLTDYQIQNTALNTRFMQQVMQHMGNGNFARDMQTMGFLKNPEKFAETQVNTQEDVPTGAIDKNGKPLMQTQSTAYRGKSAQAMEKASEALGHNRVMDTSLKELEQFEKENPLGGTPGSEAVGRARAAIQNIRLNYEATMAGMNRQASPEVIKHMEDIAKDPTALFKTGKTSGALKFLRKMLNEHKQGVLDTYTLGPTGMADGGEVPEEGGLVGSVKKYFTSGRGESAGKNVAEEASKALPKALSGHDAVETKRAQYKRAEEIAESRD